jgi:UDP-3-O-[3-hydroxymyristoyl] glucosamine N-acyltransferase
MTLEEIRTFIGEGEIVGSPSFFCRSVASLEKATADQLSFVKDPLFIDQARGSRAGALLVPRRIEKLDRHQLVLKDPHRAVALLLEKIARDKRQLPPGIHPAARVHESAEIGADVSIGAGVVVEAGARIGDRCVLYANVYIGLRSVVGAHTVLYPSVVVMEDVTIGDRVVIQGGTVIGADGYGYAQRKGRHVKIPQVGDIVIEDDVEIGALTTIDRATLDQTVIGRGTKIGDLCHIAHNCHIGEDVLVLPTVAISGSVKVGNRVVMAGRSGCADNLTIGDDAVLGGTAVAFKDVPPGASLWGNPAREKSLEMRIQAALRRLPEMQRDLRAVRKKVGV